MPPRALRVQQARAVVIGQGAAKASPGGRTMRRIHPDTTAALRAWLQSNIIILIEVDFIRSMSRGMKMSARVLTAHVPESLAREVDRLAEQLDRPRGWLMKEALARYVELENKRRALTLEALEDVDAGRVIDHDAIEAWAAKLAPRRRARHR